MLRVALAVWHYILKVPDEIGRCRFVNFDLLVPKVSGPFVVHKINWFCQSREYSLTRTTKIYYFCRAHLHELEFLIYLQNPGLKVGPLDFFEGSSSPCPTLTGQGPC